MLNFRLPLDDALAEVITIPFHDPTLSFSCTPAIAASKSVKATSEASWCYTSIKWEIFENTPSMIDVKVPASFSLDGFDTLLLAVNLPRCTSIQVCLQYPRIQTSFSRWSSRVYGTGERMEIGIPLRKLHVFGTFHVLSKKTIQTLLIRLHCGEAGPGAANFSWIGLRHSAMTSALSTHRARRSQTWAAWVLPEECWGEISFERDLVFSAEDLKSVRAKKSNPTWKAHFAHLEDHARKYLKRNPEQDYGICLPNHDKRYIRAADQGRTAYHWEALTLAFVGLVNEDKGMLKHALRYLMCMVHTRYWTDSMEQRCPSSTWNQRSFIEEMTTVSVSLLADWLSFALLPHTKLLINQALWDRGITPVRRDLLQFDYMHAMNQGVVFNRACVLGGLYLEKSWPRVSNFVDAAYEEMKTILVKYIQSDGGVAEGPGYFCQTATGALWAIIAYCRARGLDWKEEVNLLFSSTKGYIEAISSTEKPGTTIPIGDCRTNWLGGDVIPILASLFPDTAFSSILKSCLLSGSVFALTGTLSKSGGMVGMVYGPSDPVKSNNVVPPFIQLPKSAIVSSLRETANFRTRLFLMGCPNSKSHSHRDVGSFILEVNEHVIFCDRGMVEYWHVATNALSKSAFHNTVTPVIDNIYLDQEIPSKAIIPSATGDDQSLYAQVDLSPVWQKNMTKYTRVLESTQAETITVIDDIVLKNPSRVAFHLNSKYEMHRDGNSIVMDIGSFLCIISCDWAENLQIATDCLSVDFKPMYRLSAISATSLNHKLLSSIRLKSK